MKIIGKTTGGYIVELDTIEVSNIVGSNSEYSTIQTKDKDGFAEEKACNKLAVGDMLAVCDLFRKCRSVMDGWEELKSTVTSLKGKCTAVQNAVKEF
jgi:hypothetical protein